MQTPLRRSFGSISCSLDTGRPTRWTTRYCPSMGRRMAAMPIRGLIVGLAPILVATGLFHSPALGDEASALMGRWLLPSREQKKSRMSPQCQQHAETDVQRVPESEIEIFSCDDPAFASEKTRILEFVKSVNEVYRAENRPVYSETISGLCAVVRETTANEKPIFATLAKNCAARQSRIYPSFGISGHRITRNGPWWETATLHRRGTGRSPVLRGLVLIRS